MSKNNKRRNKCLVNARRWASYAAAGAASVLATNESAEAGITHVTRNTFLNSASTFLTTTGAGSIFAALGQFSFGGNSGVALVKGNPLITYGNVNGFAGGFFLYASNLPYGANVSTQNFYNLAAGYTMTMAFGGGYTYSQFLNPGIGYLGFKFDVGNGTQYGWARVDMEGAPWNAFTLIDYAYGMPGQGIQAGKVPEPGSLGLLAAGAVGLLAWRRARAKKSA